MDVKLICKVSAAALLFASLASGFTGAAIAKPVVSGSAGAGVTIAAEGIRDFTRAMRIVTPPQGEVLLAFQEGPPPPPNDTPPPPPPNDTPPPPPPNDTPPPPPPNDTPPPPPPNDTPPPPPPNDTPPPPPPTDTPPPPPPPTDTPPPPAPDTDEAVGDSLTEVTGKESEPLDPDESAQGGGSSVKEASSDALAVYENGDGVEETTEEQRLCVHGVSESACGAGEEPEEE